MKRTTIKDVARMAGVSPAVVSYIINGREGKASEDTIERVKQAIKELNYIPNLSARSLVNNKSKLIGVIIPQTEDYKQMLLQNPFYSEIVSGIESKARERGYHIILSGVDKGESYCDTSIQRNLDGAIIMGIYEENFYDELKLAKIPIVLIDSYIKHKFFYSIGIDDEYGGYMATKYLINCGHKNIAMVTGNIRKEGVNEKRFLGYKKALKEAKIPYNHDFVFEKSVSYEYGHEAGALISNISDITAVFATADLMAFGVIKGILESGKKVPDDISVIGFDNISVSKIFIPPLTTVSQDITLKGITAAEVLINAIEKNEDYEVKETLLPLGIIERTTVKKINSEF